MTTAVLSDMPLSVALIRPGPVGPLLDVDARTLTVRSVVSTPEPDRAGDVVLPGGLRNRAEFLRNPVVLWAHDRQRPPVGRCLELQVRPDRLVATTRFARGSAFAEEVFRLYEQGVLRGWSIGFVPVTAALLPPRRGGRRGLLVKEWELLEYSAVPVPENPQALTLALEKGLIADPIWRAWARRISGDVLRELVA